MPGALPEAKKAVPNEQKILEDAHMASFYSGKSPGFDYKTSPTAKKLTEVKSTLTEMKIAPPIGIDNISIAAEQMAKAAFSGNEESYKTRKKEFETAISAANRALDGAIREAKNAGDEQTEETLNEQKENLKKQNLVNDYLNELARDAHIERERNYQQHLLQKAKGAAFFSHITHEKHTQAQPFTLLEVAAGKNTVIEEGIWTDTLNKTSCMVKRDDKGKVWGAPYPPPKLTNKASFKNAYSVVIDTMLRGASSDEIFIGPLDREYVGKDKANYVSEVANWIEWYLDLAREKNRPLNVKNLFDFFNDPPESAWDPERIKRLRREVGAHNLPLEKAKKENEEKIKNDFELNKYVHKLRDDGKRADPNPPGDDEAKRRAWEAKGVDQEYKALREGVSPAAQDARLIPVDGALRRIEVTAPIAEIKNIQTQVNQDLAELAQLKDRYKLLKDVVDNNRITLPQPPPDIKAELKAIEQSIAVMGATVLRKQEEVKNATERRIKNEALINPKIEDFKAQGDALHVENEKRTRDAYDALVAQGGAPAVYVPLPIPTDAQKIQNGAILAIQSGLRELNPSIPPLYHSYVSLRDTINQGNFADAKTHFAAIQNSYDNAWVLLRALEQSNQGTPDERARIAGFLEQTTALININRDVIANREAGRAANVVLPYTPDTWRAEAPRIADQQHADNRIGDIVRGMGAREGTLRAAIATFNGDQNNPQARQAVHDAIKLYQDQANLTVGRELALLVNFSPANPQLADVRRLLIDPQVIIDARNALAPPRAPAAPAPAPVVAAAVGAPFPAPVAAAPIDRKKYIVPQAELKDEATYIQHLKTIYPAGITDAVLAQQRLADGVAYLQDANGMTQRIADAKTDAELNALKNELDTEFKTIATAYDAEHIRFAPFAAPHVGGAGNAAAWDDLIINADTKKAELDQAILARRAAVLAAPLAAPLQPPGPVVAPVPAPIPVDAAELDAYVQKLRKGWVEDAGILDEKATPLQLANAEIESVIESRDTIKTNLEEARNTRNPERLRPVQNRLGDLRDSFEGQPKNIQFLRALSPNHPRLQEVETYLTQTLPNDKIQYAALQQALQPAQGGPGAAAASASLNSERPLGPLDSRSGVLSAGASASSEQARGPLDSGVIQRPFEEKKSEPEPGVGRDPQHSLANIQNIGGRLKAIDEGLPASEGNKIALDRLKSELASYEIKLQEYAKDFPADQKLPQAATQVFSELQRLKDEVNAAIERFTPAEAALIESLRRSAKPEDKNLPVKKLVKNEIDKQVALLKNNTPKQIREKMVQAVAVQDMEALQTLQNYEIPEYADRAMKSKLLIETSPITSVASAVGMDVIKLFEEWRGLVKNPEAAALKSEVSKAIDQVTKKQQEDAQKVAEAKAVTDAAKVAAEAKAAADAAAKAKAEDEAKAVAAEVKATEGRVAEIEKRLTEGTQRLIKGINGLDNIAHNDTLDGAARRLKKSIESLVKIGEEIPALKERLGAQNPQVVNAEKALSAAQGLNTTLNNKVEAVRVIKRHHRP